MSAPGDGNRGPIVNLDELTAVRELKHAERFDATLTPVGARIGARKLGYNVTTVAPGKRPFPFHNHHVNEELFYVLEGEGTLRYGDAQHPVRAGDFVCCPAGGPAHQFINSGTVALRYIAVSTMIDCDVWQYPDSGKFGVIAGREPGVPPTQATFPSRFIADGPGVDYWQGE